MNLQASVASPLIRLKSMTGPPNRCRPKPTLLLPRARRIHSPTAVLVVAYSRPKYLETLDSLARVSELSEIRFMYPKIVFDRGVADIARNTESRGLELNTRATSTGSEIESHSLVPNSLYV